jgi:hypothetical protein
MPEKEFFNSIQAFRPRIVALISLGVLCAKDGCESQARSRPFAAGPHEMKGADRGVSTRAECWAANKGGAAPEVKWTLELPMKR